MERAVGYVRVSDSRQLNGTSLTVQKRAVTAHAAARGYRLETIFEEKGKSAKTTRSRGALDEMLKFAMNKRNGITVVVFPKIDRLARLTEDFLSLQRRLKERGVRIDSVGEHIEDTPVGRFNSLVQAGVAQLDNEIRAERCNDGMVEAVAEGRWVWKAPLGYRSVRRKGQKKKGKGTIEPHPQNGPIVTALFQMVAAGRLRTLADQQDWLRERGVDLSQAGIHHLLRNRMYTGVFHAFGADRRAQPPYVPLVDPGTFYAVQEAFAARKLRPKVHEYRNDDFPLRGTVRCGCGAFLTANWSQGRSSRYPYYRCAACVRSNFPRREVELAFERTLSSYRPARDSLVGLCGRLRSKVLERSAALRDRAKAIEKELADIERMTGALSLKNLSGVIPDDVASRQFEAFRRQTAALERERATLSNPLKEVERVLVFAVDFLRDMGEGWAGLATEQKKKLQSHLFPSGLTYEGNGSFRTAEIPLLEQVKGLVTASDFTLVDPIFEDPHHEVWKFMASLYSAFGPEEPS